MLSALLGELPKPVPAIGPSSVAPIATECRPNRACCTNGRPAGPPLAWKASGVGQGFSTVAIADDQVFTMGDLDDAAYVFCLNRNRRLLQWSAKVGETGGNYKGPRCTPTVDEHLGHVLGQFGDLVCLEVGDRP